MCQRRQTVSKDFLVQFGHFSTNGGPSVSEGLLGGHQRFRKPLGGLEEDKGHGGFSEDFELGLRCSAFSREKPQEGELLGKEPCEGDRVGDSRGARNGVDRNAVGVRHIYELGSRVADDGSARIGGERDRVTLLQGLKYL